VLPSNPPQARTTPPPRAQRERPIAPGDGAHARHGAMIVLQQTRRARLVQNRYTRALGCGGECLDHRQSAAYRQQPRLRRW
jgi:hypothetical protein